MNDGFEAIRSLLVSGLHGSISVLPDVQDWEIVFNTSEKQGIHGICADGLQNYSDRGIAVPGLDNPGLFLSKMSWLGGIVNLEKRFKEYESAIRHLSDFSLRTGIPMMILKGYGCCLNYPHPNHRVCGDIDIFCFGRQVEFDEAVSKELGITVSQTSRHHSTFAFEGFIVENHKTILDPDSHKENKGLNTLLAKEAEFFYRDEVLQIILPSARFNSIHLLSHMASDFVSTGTTLRRLLDWSTFVFANKSKIDWDFTYKVAEEFGMSRFLNSINDICIRYLEYPEAVFPAREPDRKLSDKILRDMLKEPAELLRPEKGGLLRYGLVKSKRFFQNGWKHRIVYKDKLITSFIKKSINRFK